MKLLRNLICCIVMSINMHTAYAIQNSKIEDDPNMIFFYVRNQTPEVMHLATSRYNQLPITFEVKDVPANMTKKIRVGYAIISDRTKIASFYGVIGSMESQSAYNTMLVVLRAADNWISIEPARDLRVDNKLYSPIQIPTPSNNIVIDINPRDGKSKSFPPNNPATS